MNAITFLINEHNRVRKTFIEISQASQSEAKRMTLFADLCQDLLIHELMEQTVWYPRLQQYEDLNKIINHLLSEEKKAKMVIESFPDINNKGEWGNTFEQLLKDVDHHANEEETNLFPKVQELLSEETLNELGEQMEQFKLSAEGSTRKAA